MTYMEKNKCVSCESAVIAVRWTNISTVNRTKPSSLTSPAALTLRSILHLTARAGRRVQTAAERKCTLERSSTSFHHLFHLLPEASLLVFLFWWLSNLDIFLGRAARQATAERSQCLIMCFVCVCVDIQYSTSAWGGVGGWAWGGGWIHESHKCLDGKLRSGPRLITCLSVR